MKEIKVKILSNEKIAHGRFKIRLEAPSICRLAKPGQFVMVKCSNGDDTFLRRPLSFHRIEKRYLELLYQVVGKGTKILSERKKDEGLDLIGPLGNGFEIEQRAKSKEQRVLVGGGIAVAPLLELAKRLTTYNLRLTTLLGAKTKDHILCVEDFKRLGVKVETATEDGSQGYKGLVTDLLRDRIAPSPLPSPPLRGGEGIIYACGPKDMLKEVADIAKSRRTPCQVSLEENMACGTGACLGCAVRTKSGFKMVCKDGPVFDAGDIIW